MENLINHYLSKDHENVLKINKENTFRLKLYERHLEKCLGAKNLNATRMILEALYDVEIDNNDVEILFREVKDMESVIAAKKLIRQFVLFGCRLGWTPFISRYV